MILITKGRNGEGGEIGDPERTGENRLEHGESIVDEGDVEISSLLTLQLFWSMPNAEYGMRLPAPHSVGTGAGRQGMRNVETHKKHPAGKRREVKSGS